MKIKLPKINNLLLSLLSLLICVSIIIMSSGFIFIQKNVYASAISRYTVLVLDTSGSESFLSGNTVIYTADTAIEHVKSASKKFLSDILKASGNNYVAVIGYNSTATIISDFTQDIGSLNTKIAGLLSTDTDRSVTAGLEKAESLISAIKNINAKKNVVLFTTGMTDAGEYKYTGYYDSSVIGGNWCNLQTSVNLYAYSNIAIEKANILKEEAKLYTIGLFHEFDGMPQQGQSIVAFFKLFTKDLASSSNEYFEVLDPNDIKIVFDEVAETITNGIFSFTYSGINGQRTSECVYDDNYFNHSSLKYDHALATMSLSLAMTAFGDKTKPYGDERVHNCVELLDALGFQDIIPYGYEKTPGIDTIAVVFAHKSISCDDGIYELFVTAIRGGNYEMEWAGNFRITDDNNFDQQIHRGFEKARETLSDDYFPKYINTVKSINAEAFDSPLKLWVTGYSRSAAVAGLFISHIQSNLKSNILTTSGYKDSFNINRENIFGYCFASPNNTSKDNKDDASFNNIFNIMNQNDIVTRVAPYCWGYDKYGIRLWLDNPTGPNKNKKSYNALETETINEFYKIAALNKDDYLIDDFIYHQGNTNAIQRAIYDMGPHTKYNKSLSLFLDDNNREGCSLTNLLFKILVKSKNNYISDFQSIVIERVAENNDNAFEILAHAFVELGDTTAVGKGTESNDAAVSVARVDNVTVRINPDDFKNALITPDKSQAQVKRNLEAISQAHEPELYLAWMHTLPDDYFSEAILYNKVYYRIIRVNCSVDIEVYDKNEILVGIIKDNIPDELIDSGITLGIDDDEQKAIYMPAEENYTIKIVATDGGSLSLQINEYSRDSFDYTRSVNYYEIPLIKGDALESVIGESNLNDEKTIYILQRSNGANKGEVIWPDEDLIQGEINSYDVMTKTIGEGITSGDGTRIQGAFANMTATPAVNYDFDGWYKGDQLITNSSEYRFCVRETVELTAVFINKPITTIVENTTNTTKPINLVTDGIDEPDSETAFLTAFLITLIVGVIVIVKIISKNKKPKNGSDSSAGSIKIMNGCMAGMSFTIPDNKTIFAGRDKESSQIIFYDDYNKVSRRHCSFLYNTITNQYTVVDMSVNGTYLENGIRLQLNTPTYLQRGVILSLADKNCLIQLM